MQFSPFMIPILALMIPIIAIWVKHREKLEQMRLDSSARHGGDDTAPSSASYRELEDRVAVLERIVTDRSYDIATQIEALRDERGAEAPSIRRMTEGAA